jgi:hypothetical protein
MPVFKKAVGKKGEFQKDKANAELPNNWAPELGSIRGNVRK